MIKKTLGIITILLIFSLVAAWYYFTRESKYFNTSALKAVPVNSALVLKIQDLPSFSGKAENKFAIEMSQFPGLYSVTNDLKFVDSLIQIDSNLQKYLAGKGITIAYGAGESNDVPLYIMEFADMAEKTTINTFIHDYFERLNAVSVKRKEGEASAEIFYWSEGPNRTTFCISFYSGLCIASKNPGRVTESIRQIDLPGLGDDEKFQKLIRTASTNADINIYINRTIIHETIDDLFSTSFLEKIKHRSGKGSWTELDFTLKESELLFNGFTLTDDSVMDYMNLLSRQRPAPFDLEKYIPDETCMFLCLNVENTSAWFKDYEEYLEGRKELYEYRNSLSETDSLYGLNLQSFVKENMDRQAGIVIKTGHPDSIATNSFFIMKTSSSIPADSLIMKLTRLKGKSYFWGMVKEFKMGRDTSFKIFQLPVNNFSQRVFGEIFSGISTNYAAVFDNCMIMGSTVESISEYIRSLFLHETLNNNPAYKEFASSISQPLTLYTWISPGKALPLFKKDISPGFYRRIESRIEILQNIESAGWQMGSENEMIYNTGRLVYNTETIYKPTSSWKIKLDTLVCLKPQPVISYGKGDNRELIVLDMANNLYHISREGLIQWRKKLPGPVLSQIYQVNYYWDKRCQYLFNTAEAIHMVDGEGNYIPGYPVKLNSKATNGLGVFDYDGTLDYRLFLACEDKNIYVWNRNGKIIEGWQSTPSESTVTMPVQYFRVADKDYIVYSDKEKTYIMDRRGNPRVIIKDQFPRSRNNEFTFEPANALKPAEIVTTEPDGTICKIDFNGQVKKIKTGTFSENHYFKDEDLNADGSREYIYVDKDALKVYNCEGNLIFSRKYQNIPDIAPVLFEVPGKGKKIGVADRQANAIFLYNEDGSICEGFPVEGNSPFVLGLLNSESRRYNLVVGTDEYLNNYIIK